MRREEGREREEQVIEETNKEVIYRIREIALNLTRDVDGRQRETLKNSRRTRNTNIIASIPF